jgi:glucokinase
MLAAGIDLTRRPGTVLLVEDTGRVVSRRAAASSGAATLPRTAAGSIAGMVYAVPEDVPVPRGPRGGPPVRSVSPGAAFVTAETWLGAAAGARNAVCLHVGHHVFAGLLIDGRVWEGAHGRAGAAAWLALNPVERQDYRRVGSLAAEVGEEGIAHRLSWRIQAGDESRVLQRAGSLEAITAAHVFDGAREGDGVAISVVRDTARYLAMAIASLAATIDPEVVVIGGSIAAAADLLLEPVRHETARRLPPAMSAALRIESSALGDDAVALGAARLAMEAAD